ncbi:MAG TPA: hypothetical protein VGX71_23630 [Pseudaminobacter sp.]|nr:hypothetical protein [Pseudaminobacter sp.]
MDHAVDANLCAPPNDRALIDFDARRQETLVLDDAALERRCGPIRTWSPISTAFRLVLRMLRFSRTTHWAPIRTGAPCASITAPNETRVRGPIVTSPQITAVGAT